MLPTYLMFDAAFPPLIAPAGYKAVAGYIGGDTPHVWTPAEWARFSGLKKLPVFVRSNPGAPGTPGAKNDAWTALEALYNLRVPKGTAVALDLETAVDPAYVGEFNGVITWAGYRVWNYGSAATVFGNPGSFWVADYAGQGPFMYNHAGVRATQYASGPAYDSSVIKQWDYWFSLSRNW